MKLGNGLHLPTIEVIIGLLINANVSKPRQENSLGELTKKFITLIKQTEDYCIDLNDAVKSLNVQK